MSGTSNSIMLQIFETISAPLLHYKKRNVGGCRDVLGCRFTLQTDHKSLVWLNSVKEMEGMMSRWMHLWMQQFHFVIVHRAGRYHGNADGLSRVLTSPCPQCSREDCRQIITIAAVPDQTFDSNSVGSSMDSGHVG